MPKRAGLNAGEKVLDSIRAALQNIKGHGQGVQSEHFTKGELVLTQNGVVFIETTGVLSTKQVRHHSYDYDLIKAVRTESRGLTGSLTGEEFLVVVIDNPGNVSTLKYSCHKEVLVRIKDKLAHRVSLKVAIEQFEKALIRYIKPVASINLREVASAKEIRNSLSRILSKSNLSEDIVFSGVVDRVRILVANGVLEGVIDSSGMYTSNASLSRKSVQYQVAIDFTGLFTQLKGKGIVLESLECPSCKGTLQYPESGSVVSCTFCGSTVSAIDVFDKFKGLLDV